MQRISTWPSSIGCLQAIIKSLIIFVRLAVSNIARTIPPNFIAIYFGIISHLQLAWISVYRRLSLVFVNWGAAPNKFCDYPTTVPTNQELFIRRSRSQNILLRGKTQVFSSIKKFIKKMKHNVAGQIWGVSINLALSQTASLIYEQL